MRGRKPDPEHLRVLKGGKPSDAPADPAPDPVDDASRPEMPDWLAGDSRAVDEWDQLLDIMPPEWVRATDQHALAVYCATYSEYVGLVLRVRRRGRTTKHTNKAGATNRVRKASTLLLKEARESVLKQQAELGLSPVARRRLQGGGSSKKVPPKSRRSWRRQ